MKKIFKFSFLLLAMLIGFSQGAWADTYYYAKAKAQVSSKSNGMGTVYIGPAVQFASADEATSYDGSASTSSVPFRWASADNDMGLDEGMPYIDGSEDQLPHWMAPAGTEAVIYRGLSITDAGTAKPVYAGYMAQAYPGYYFKGWSTIENDVALGNVNPFAYPVMSQAMTTSAEVKEVQVYVPTMVNGKLQQIAQTMPNMYVAEGKSNRYLMVTKDDDVYRCPKVDGQYALYDMDPTSSVQNLYIPHFDNVTRHVYVINDNGEKVEIKDVDGSYLTFPKDADGNTIVGATYIIYKNPYYKVAGNPLRNYEFLPHRYNMAALASCTNDACFQQTMLTPDFTSPNSTLLLVNFQAIMVGGMPAAAVKDNGDPIAFLPSMEELPSVPTMYATFAPVQINGCTGGNIVNWSDVADNTFNVTFSTSYASDTEDFGAITFDKQPEDGVYSAEVTGYNDNEVTIAVTFTPNGELADGEYKASMTLPSKGGESYVSCLVNVRVGEEANKAVAVTINGEETKYGATSEDLTDAFTAAMSNPGAEVKLLSNLTLVDVTTAGNFTFDLDGWTLNLPDGNTSVTGTLLLKNGTVNGNVSIASTGNITVDGVTINGTLTNAGIANLKRGTFNGGTGISINNSGSLTLEKGVEVISNVCGVNMTDGIGTVNGAKFYGSAPFNIVGGDGVFNSAYFTHEFAELVAMGMTHYDVTVGPAFEAGYTHLYAKDLDAAQAAGAPVCKIGQTGYSSLEDALLYAQNNPTQQVTIIMLNDYTLPAGYYTLPKNASLLIPYQENQTSIMGGSPKKLAISQPYETPSPYRTLTFANGVHMSVAGNIEASCMQFIAGKGETGNAVPSGAYGWLLLEKGAEVTLGNGSHLYAWGFVTGEGEIDVRRGGAVHEDFQVYDWPGGNAALDMLQNSIQSGAGAFPINQYFMQNVESQTTFHPGARMYCSFGASAAGLQVAADAIQIVGIEGDIAMFLMDPNDDADNTWVRKRYDIENDIQVWEVNSGAHLGSMYIEVPLLKSFSNGAISGFDSRNFILPLTNNLKIHLLSGYMDITQNTELLPGAEIEMDKESTIELLEASDASSGFLYLIDKADWDDNFACGRPGQQILYSPSWVERGHADGKPNVRNINSIEDEDFANSKVNVHGTFQVSGFVLATPHAANIVSTNEDAGTVVFPNEVDFSTVLDNQPVDVHMPIAAIPNQLIDAMLGEGAGFPVPHCRTTQKSNGEYNNGVMQEIPARSALLHNGIGDPAESAGTTTNEIQFVEIPDMDLVPALMIPGWEPQDGDNFTMPGESFCYMGDRWTKMKQFDDRFAYDNYNEWYIKPAEYVEVASTSEVDSKSEFAGMATMPLENPDHTYSDAAGEGRLFIWVESPSDGAPGQWWEVTLEDNLYKGKNGTYYEYKTIKGHNLWVEHTFNITWLNWDGSPVLDHDDEATVYEMHYGDRIQYLGTNPTRKENVDYTYNFTGWSPALTADSKVTGDATYMATFEAVQRKYTIIFLNENGTEIERHFLTRDEMPVCEALPSKTGYYLQWTPAIGAVTGDTAYRATFTPEKPTEFMITFKNYDGTELQSYMVGVGQTPACTAPSKPATSEYTYAFDGWNPAIEPVSQEMTYTAKFKEQAKEYAIRFFDEHGELIGETQNLAYGVAPAMPDYVKDADAEYTYTTTWTPQVAAVTKAQDYTAVITRTKNKYTVTCIGEGCAFTGAGSYEYGEGVRLTLAAQTNYENAQWSDGTTDDKVITVTGDVTFTASATLNPGEDAQLFTITFLDENDVQISQMQKLINTVPSCDYKITPEEKYLTTWTPEIQRVRRDITYKATPVLRKYTITCEGEHCIFTGAGTYDYGTEVTLTLAAAEGYENAQWSDGTTGNKVITVTDDATYTASATLIPAPEEPEDKTAVLGEEFDLSTPIVVSSFTFEAGADQSAYIKGSITNLNFKDEMEVYYKYHFNAEAGKWYAFGVPFKVNGDQAVGTKTLVREKDYRIVRYNGALRATNGADGSAWEIVSGTLVPGELYMIKFLANVDVVTFTGVDNNDGLDYSTSAFVNEHSATNSVDANWNGIANPALYYAKLGVGIEKAQIYDPEKESYATIQNFADSVLSAGSAVFVQISAVGSVSVDVTPSDPIPAAVAARRAVVMDDTDRYVLELSQNGKSMDKVILESSEEAENRYVIGEDLAKAGVSNIVGQMWVNRYGAKLCVNNAAPVSGETTYPLGIFAPKAGQYTITLTETKDDMEVVLLENNVPVSVLSAAQNITLPKGTTTDYSIVVRKAPRVTTDVESVVVDNAAQKVFVDGTLYILKDGRVFDAMGKLVK